MSILAVPPEPVLRGLDPREVDEAPEGTVYLLHLDIPLMAWTSDYTWTHYIGHARQGNLLARLEAHQRGRGARFTRKARERGCTWHLARVWAGSYDLERKIKKQGGASRFCPSCGIVTAAERQKLRDPRGRYISPARST